MAADHNQEASEITQPDFTHLTQKSHDFLEMVCKALSQYTVETGAMKDIPQIKVSSDSVLRVCGLLKDASGIELKMLHCLTCVDYESYVEMVYFLHSMSQEQFLVLKADVDYEALEIESVTGLWAAANWDERVAQAL